MKTLKFNTVLLLICTALLTVCAFGIFSRPTIEEIDQRMMMWGQHYGTHFSEVNKQKNEKAVTLEVMEETEEK